ncbi:MAG: prohibitin family protein [Alphaproteobacteria bacterium]|nr:prohibitin family protein [Alphaproteobacteria bacterium]
MFQGSGYKIKSCYLKYVMLFKRTFYCFNFIFMYGYEDRESKNWSVKKIMKWAGAGIGSLLVLIALISAFYSISPGYRGVLITLGKVSQHSYINGVGFKWPFVSSMIKMDVRTRKMTDKTSTYTSDIQTADLEYTFTYDLNPENIHILYEKVGLDYEAKAILPSLNDVLKDVIGKWQAQELVANRDKARVDVVAGLQERLDRRFFQNITFQFINIDYSDKFEGAIEDKVIAEQKAQEAVNNTKRIKEEAEQKLISAKAEAEAMEIKSEALSKNKGLTEYEAVQKWDGKLPQYMLGNSTPFVNLSGK